MTASGNDFTRGERSHAVAAALRLLNRRDYAREELRRRLLEKGHPEADVAAALDRVAAMGYLDDARFAALVAESAFRNKGWGPARIARALTRQGVDPETAAAALAPYRDEEAEAARAADLLMRRARASGDGADAGATRRARQYLLRRGFSTGAVTAAVRELKRVSMA